MNNKYNGYAIWSNNIDLVQEIHISESEFDDIRCAQHSLMAIRNVDEKYFLVSESYKNFEKYIFEVKLDGLLYDVSEVRELHSIRIETSRLAHSYLSSVSLYVENVHIKKLRKIDPSIQKDFYLYLKESSAECVAVTKLRNFAHHNDLAATHAEYGRGWSGDLTQVMSLAEFYFEADRLTYDNKTTIEQLKLIKTLGHRIELKQLFRKYFRILAATHHELQKLFESRSTQSRNLIEDVRRNWLGTFHGFRPDCSGVVAGKLQNGLRDESVPLISLSVQVSENLHAVSKRIGSLENMKKRIIIW
jgi:hypothetical protein